MVRAKDGYTPLHVAAEYGNAEFIDILLEAGAYTNAKNEDGKTPWDIARKKFSIELQ